MTNEMLSSEGFGGRSAWAVGGTMKISLYSLAVNGKINKITLSFELDEHGEFKKHDDKISYSVDKSIINKGQYNAEKKDYENKANGE